MKSDIILTLVEFQLVQRVLCTKLFPSATCKVQSTKYKLHCTKCKAQSTNCKVHIALDNEELHQQRSNNDTNAGINVAVLFLLELSICVNYRY